MSVSYRLSFEPGGSDLVSMDHAGTSIFERYQTPFLLATSLILWILLIELVDPYISQPIVVMSSTALVVVIGNFCIRLYLQRKELMAAEQAADSIGSLSILIDEKGIRYISNRSTTAFQWPEFAKVAVFDELVELETHDRETAIVPAEPFENRSEYLECVVFIETQVRLSAPVLN